ncbi:MAG: phosphopantetheine-binding protein [Microcystaceae cyanobacterium]
MKREQILNVVIENIKLNVDGLENVEINPEKSIVQYGGSSLDIVEIVSSIIRQLQIKIPRTQLADMNSINDLVDLLTKVKNEAS